MGHTITHQVVDSFSELLTQGEVEDLINFFYRWKDTRFEVTYKNEQRYRRGLHLYVHHERTHRIVLSPGPIIRAVEGKQRIGGNGTAPGLGGRDSLRVGAAMVLVHELQHANQAGQHLATEKFYTHRDYNTRPCEREARTFVDSNLREIMTMVAPELLSVVVPGQAMCADGDTVEDILCAFEGLDEVSVDDIRKELRLSGLNNPINLGRVMHELRAAGVMVK